MGDGLREGQLPVSTSRRWDDRRPRVSLADMPNADETKAIREMLLDIIKDKEAENGARLKAMDELKELDAPSDK